MENLFDLTGAINGYCAKCIGRGNCPKPFDKVIGYHIEGVSDNILADNDIKDDWRIERVYNNKDDAYLLTSRVTGEQVVFDNRHGQFHADIINENKKCFLNSAYYQRLALTKNSIERMVRIEKMHQSMAYIGLQYLRKMIQNNMWHNCSLTTDDVDNYAKYMHERSCRGCAFGKRRAEGQFKRPLEMNYVKIGALVCIDILYITTHLHIKKQSEALAGLICVDAFSGFKSIFWLRGRNENHIRDGIAQCLAEYNEFQHPIIVIRMDNESGTSKLKEFLLNRRNPIMLERSQAGRHVVEIETQIRYLKSLWRATILGVSFGVKCPRFFYSYAFKDCVNTANMIISKNNEHVSPDFMFKKSVKPEYKFYSEHKFGDVVTFYHVSDNQKDEDARADIGVILERNHCSNTFEIYNLRTKKMVKRGIRDCHLFEADTEVRKLIRAVDSDNISDKLSVPKLFLKKINQKATEILDEDDEHGNIFHELEEDSIKKSNEVFDDQHLIRNASDVEEHDHLNDFMSNIALEDVDNNLENVEMQDTGSATARVPMANSDESASEMEIVQDEETAEPTTEEHSTEHSPTSGAEPKLTGNNRGDSVRRLRRHINTLELLNGRGFTPHFSEIRARKRRALATHISFRKSKAVFGESAAKTAILKELRQMTEKDVWRMLRKSELRNIQKKKNINILPSSLFLKDKYDASGIFEKLKARLVCCGNYQEDGTGESYKGCGVNESPTVNLNTVLALLSISAKEGLCKKIFDVSGAYLNAELDEYEYMRLGKDVTNTLLEDDPSLSEYLIGETMVVELRKALYGLKQASRAWYDLLSRTLIDDGFSRSKIDACLFSKYNEEKEEQTYVLVYVDDLLVLSTHKEGCEDLKSLLINKFKEITEQEGSKLSFIGLELQDDSEGNIRVSQKGYIEKLLSEYNITACEKYPSNGILQEDHSGECDKDSFLQLVMKAMYAATRTRPDILYQTTTLASRSANPTEKDMESLLHILKYLNGTKEFGLVYKSTGEILLSCYIDASFNCHGDARGHSGYVIFPDTTGSSGILFKSCKQKRVADSSAESELMALHESIQYLIYVSNLFEELGYKQETMPVFEDNVATIQMASSEQVNFKGKSKFINRKYFGVHQYVEDGTIKLVHVGTESNVADFLTKELQGKKFFRFRIDILGDVREIIRGTEHII